MSINDSNQDMFSEVLESKVQSELQIINDNDIKV